jgi:hypothetical protein
MPITDDDPTPIHNVGPYDLFLRQAIDLRDEILVRAQQLFKQNDQRSQRCYELAKDVQIVVDAIRAHDPATPAQTEYQLDSDVLDDLRDRARLLGVLL